MKFIPSYLLYCIKSDIVPIKLNNLIKDRKEAIINPTKNFEKHKMRETKKDHIFEMI